VTKPDVFALGAGGEDVADLDLLVRDDHAIDEQLDQLPLSIEAHLLEARRDPFAERCQRGGQPERLIQAVGFPGEPRLLLGQGRVPRLELGAPTPVLRHGDDPAEVGLGQPLELLGQRRLPLTQTLTACVEFLRVPGADRGPTEGLRHDLRLPEQLAEVSPDQVIDGLGRDVPGPAAGPVAVPGLARLARADVVAIVRREPARHAGQPAPPAADQGP
jgi:hypothetical protein